jgi:hypothetical protein
MTRNILLLTLGALFLAGWAWARAAEMLNHSADARLQEMQDASCPPSSDPSGAG